MRKCDIFSQIMPIFSACYSNIKNKVTTYEAHFLWEWAMVSQ